MPIRTGKVRITGRRPDQPVYSIFEVKLDMPRYPRPRSRSTLLSSAETAAVVKATLAEANLRCWDCVERKHPSLVIFLIFHRYFVRDLQTPGVGVETKLIKVECKGLDCVCQPAPHECRVTGLLLRRRPGLMRLISSFGSTKTSSHSLPAPLRAASVTHPDRAAENRDEQVWRVVCGKET